MKSLRDAIERDEGNSGKEFFFRWNFFYFENYSCKLSLLINDYVAGVDSKSTGSISRFLRIMSGGKKPSS